MGLGWLGLEDRVDTGKAFGDFPSFPVYICPISVKRKDFFPITFGREIFACFSGNRVFEDFGRFLQRHCCPVHAVA